MSHVLEAHGVWKAYRPRDWVLRGIDLVIDSGEFVVIVGPNGSGKTTFLKIVSGLLRPSRGEVKVCGHKPWSTEAKRCRGVVMHWSFLYDELTVAENLGFYASLSGAQGYNPRRDSLVATLGLDKRLRQLVAWLSFGWRKRTDLVRAMLGSPKLLVLDEPLTGLDPGAGTRLLEFLKAYVEKGGSVLAATPKGEEELLKSATRVYDLVNGKLVERKP